ncbi:DNA repair protein Dds20 [Teratosphaeria destructans]|uniref:DNA repair protein Dds20 n=1 Tax=Teratosphaeria destructans TaxID=418781 RepID=A0A9W7SMF9_9PEZI|nr:DNA repair protein Dds20 [Teratosphaeria destructans]
MSSPVPAKRRRLNDATHTLSKPFVSPLRSAKPARQPLSEQSNLANQPYTPSTLAHNIKATQPDPSAPKQSTTTSTPVRKHAVPITSTKKRTDPAEFATQKALTALELQIKSLRNDLDALKQAANITSSATDAELDSLTTKWRLASQQAAEELFGTVKERVCRMGGVAPGARAKRRSMIVRTGWGREELPEEEQQFRRSEKRRLRQEAMEAMDGPDNQWLDVGVGDGKPKVWQEEGKDDDSFTMDMMLRSLNIDLKVIGYEKGGQRWIL